MFPIIGGTPADARRQLVYSLSKYLLNFYFASVKGYRGEKANRRQSQGDTDLVRETTTKVSNVIFC